MTAPGPLDRPKRAAIRRVVDFARWRVYGVRQMFHDLLGNLANRTLGPMRSRVHPGNGAARDRIAIYVIFPSTGLLDSHLAALSALDRAGYATVVVSNLALAPADRSRVLVTCWRLIERPNFGYDFGAYRDGILHVWPNLPSVKRLVLMNDSVWFPIPGSRDWLAEAEALGADMVGAVWNHGLEPVDLNAWQSFRWAPDPTAPGYHYCSFALSLGPAILTSPAFYRFWKSIWLTDDKIGTVEAGEVGLSRTLINAGFSHGCTLDLSGMARDLEGMTHEELAAFVRTLVIPQDPDAEAFRDRVLADCRSRFDEAGHRMLRQAALVVVALTGPAYAMPRYLLARHGYAFLKKSPLRLARSGALETLDVARSLRGDEGKTIHCEAQSMLR